MSNERSGIGPRGERFGPGEAPQMLGRLQGTGAKVVGSDGQKVGELKEVGDADLVVERTLRRDLHVPVRHVREVTTDDEVVLDVPADRANDISWERASTETGPAVNFSEDTEHT